jgi:hypothetical protein
MAWEARYGGRYYYRSVRKGGGRVSKQYYGRGPAAELAAALDAEEKERRRAEAGAVALLGASLAPAGEAAAALDRAARLAAEAVLSAGVVGKRAYGRGRDAMDGGVEGEGPAAVADSESEIRDLLARARAGDESAVPALRRALAADAAIWSRYADLGWQARRTWIALISGSDLALREALELKAAALLEELAGPGAPPLERLLAERVVATWLEVNHADAMAANSAGASIRQADFATRRQGSASRRHLAAIAALAAVRRLMPAAIEIATTAVPEQADPHAEDAGRPGPAGEAGVVRLIPFAAAGATGPGPGAPAGTLANSP